MGVWHSRSRRLCRGPDWTTDSTVRTQCRAGCALLTNEVGARRAGFTVAMCREAALLLSSPVLTYPNRAEGVEFDAGYLVRWLLNLSDHSTNLKSNLTSEL